MKHSKIHMPNLSYIAAFVIGVILFAMFWKMLAGAASSAVVLAGMIGVAVAVTAFWLRNESHYHGRKGN
ncbi:MAG: hypothetical protein C4557_09475 [Anaerolineaceae bacterium]|jgi:hypothetical protein|nr:MAG: hypothetical protein C4557_09475 [Anaerolineaceae bacterium]